MTGFGLYETLRLLLPGSIAVAVLTLVLRLASGEGHLLASGPFESVVGALQGATFLFASLAAGLMLYLVDIPSRARLSMEGDPDNSYILPTSQLGAMLKGTRLEAQSFSLYFILSDGKLPAELHRRVYFFGGMYRIYFDLRMLAAFGAALGGAAALAIEGGPVSTPASPSYVGYALLILVAMLLITLVGESKHAVESMRKQARKDRTTYPSRQLWDDYLGRTRQSAKEIVPAVASIAGLAGAGAYLCDWESLALKTVGLGLVMAAASLWLMIELGPPRSEGTGADMRLSGPVRGRALGLVRLRPNTKTQYSQLQRGMADVALLAGPLMASAVSADNLGRAPLAVLLWGLLALPASLVMSVRKHEQRLLVAYKDQVNWLKINESNIKKLAARDPDEWL